MVFFSEWLENIGIVLGFGAGHGAEAGMIVSSLLIFAVVCLIMLLGVRNIWALIMVMFPLYLMFVVLGWMPLWTLLLFVFMLLFGIITGVVGKISGGN